MQPHLIAAADGHVLAWMRDHDLARGDGTQTPQKLAWLRLKRTGCLPS
jgi:hypothetical protein